MIRTVVILAALLSTPATSAKTAVYRCVGAQGQTVFSGLPCSATAMATQPGAGATEDGHDDWLNHCAATANDLRDRVAAAFDAHDVNLLGGLFLWRGISDRNAYRHMRDLRDLVHQPLAGLTINGTPAWQADNGYDALPDHANTWLSLTVADAANHESAQANDASEPMVEHQFALVERNACVWLTF